MSIFETIPTCEICHKAEPAKTKNGSYKKRCKRCSERYDSQGVAFVVYCEFWRFTSNGHLPGGYSRGDVTFWLCEGIVQRAPVPFGHIVGKTADYLEVIMKASHYTIENIEPPLMP